MRPVLSMSMIIAIIKQLIKVHGVPIKKVNDTFSGGSYEMRALRKTD